MKSVKRKGVWVSLLLVGILGVSGDRTAWASEWPESEEVEWEEGVTDEVLSEDSIVIESVSQEENEGFSDNVSQNETETMATVSSEELIEEQKTLSENVTDMERSFVEEEGLSDRLGQEVNESLENRDAPEEIQESAMSVSLPAEIPIDMVVLGEEKQEGMIRSKQFCIENTGYEDVRISIQGKCITRNEEDYVVADSPTTVGGGVQGKKNIWIYLQWEDEEREQLDRAGIVLGDASNPGSGEIVLEAPKRDENGEIQGINHASRTYFSFAGDMRSDTGERWENGEVKLDLEISAEII